MARRRLIPVYLDADEYKRLDELAYRESRIPEQQASYLLRRALSKVQDRMPESADAA